MRKSDISSLFLRLGLGIVFIIFGIGKFTNDIWAQTMRNIPALQAIPISMDILIYLDGAFLLVTGSLLVLGLFTRLAALFASFQLVAVLILLKFGEVRDIALLAASLSLLLSDSKFLSFDSFRKKNEAA
ncbi:MAG: DoxX family protein [Nanoarchaeota archaeon]